MSTTKTHDLARAAGFVYFHNQQNKKNINRIDWSCDYSTELNQFAELIVQECIQVIDHAVTHRIPASEYVDLIKQHFNPG